MKSDCGRAPLGLEPAALVVTFWIPLFDYSLSPFGAGRPTLAFPGGILDRQDYRPSPAARVITGRSLVSGGDAGRCRRCSPWHRPLALFQSAIAASGPWSSWPAPGSFHGGSVGGKAISGCLLGQLNLAVDLLSSVPAPKDGLERRSQLSFERSRSYHRDSVFSESGSYQSSQTPQARVGSFGAGLITALNGIRCRWVQTCYPA